MKGWRRTLVRAEGSLELISSQSTDISEVHKEFLLPHLICNICNFAFQKQQKMHSEHMRTVIFFCKRNIFQAQVKQTWKSHEVQKLGGSSHLDLQRGAFKETRPITLSVGSTQYVSQYIPFQIVDEISALLKFLTRKALPLLWALKRLNACCG